MLHFSRILAAPLFAAFLLLSIEIAPAATPDSLPPGANTVCPVMTDQPTKGSKSIDYQGRRIYFCCDKCLKKFAANPAKYLPNLPGATTQMTAPASAAATTQPAPKPTATNTNPSAGPHVAIGTALKQLFGKLHIATVHFPIALLLVAAAIELWPFRNRTRRPADAAYLCLALAALAAVSAAAMGWVLAATTFDAGDGKTLFLHRWLGTALAAAALLLLPIAARSRRRETARWLWTYRLGLLTCAAAVALVGHLGGMLAYGDDYYTSIFHPDTPPSTASTPLAPQPAPPPASSLATSAPASPSLRPSDTDLQAILFGTDADLRSARIRARLAYVPKPPPPPQVSAPVFNDIDRFIVQRWQDAKLPEAASPPPVCDDATFARRAYLDVIGVIPTAAESAAFLADTSPDKRAHLIDTLLARSDDYAAHWTPWFEDGIASTATDIIGGIPTHGNYQKWIFDSFKANKPYDVMVQQLLDPTVPGYQKKDPVDILGVATQRGYVMNSDHKDTLATASNVGQFFLGTEMKCASCHSHFLNADEWPQTRFLAFAGMFAPKNLELIRCEKSSGKFIPARFPFAIPGAPTTMPSDENQRLHLVTRLLTDPANPRFARTLVNRLWKKYLGLGLFEPADDYREDSPPTNPQLLDWLAYDFIEHGYDIKHTERLILTSRTYQLRYDPRLEDHFDLAKREAPRYYRSPSLRRMTYEQLLDSMRVASTQKLDDSWRLYHSSESTALTRALGKPGNRNEISTARPDDVAIVQSLELLNGPEWYNLAYRNKLVGDLAQDPKPNDVIDRLYRTVLSRPPTASEMKISTDFLAASVLPTTRQAPPKPVDITWLDDALPDGAHPSGTANAKSWHWVSAPDPVFSGQRSHLQHAPPGKAVQHIFTGATHPLELASDADTLYAYVYLDPKDPPKEVMLQWNDGGWEHRAYWGDNLIPFGQDLSPTRHPAGPLPSPGTWTRLQVPASAVGLSPGAKINGLSFDQFGGKAFWDKAGVVKNPSAESPAIGDLLWALFTSPEFQYIR